MEGASGTLLVGFADEPTSHQLGLFGLEQVAEQYRKHRLYAGPGPASPEIFERIRIGLGDRTIQTAALLSQIPDSDHLWIAYEWIGRLVVSEALQELVGDLEGRWRVTSVRDDLGLVILDPLPPGVAPANSETDPSAFRNGVLSNRAGFAVVHTTGVPDLRQWFGDLAEETFGGANVLYTISAGDRTPESIVLRNPTALGMRIESDPEALVQRLSRGELIAQSHGSIWSEESGAVGNRGEYLVILTLDAPVDPDVIIPTGAIFEQWTPTAGHQALATTAPVEVTVSPGRQAVVGVRAWCLNQNLAPPSGQLVRPTPLTLTWRPDDQSALWQSIKERLAANRG